MDSSMFRFENLDVWQKSTNLSVDIYKTLFNLNDFGFKNQITRSSLSIPSNIAEGFERTSRKEKAAFLNYAKGSSGELRTQIYIGINIDYIQIDKGKYWISESESVSKMLNSLILKYKK